MSNETLKWFALKAVYGQALKAKEMLSRREIVSFVPMHKVTKQVSNCSKIALVPVLNNLIFAQATDLEIRELVRDFDYLHHIYNRVDGQNKPSEIDPEEMERFIAFTESREDHLVYANPADIELDKGDRVRVVGGVFDGAEGVFVKVKGRRSRQVVVAIEGHVAMMIAQMDHTSLVKI